MGKWTLQTVNATCSNYDTGELFGSNFIATFRLKYSPSAFSKFKETPLLDWNETIMMNEHHKGEHWVFNTNMYKHNPLSKTLEIWAKRYIAAYDSARGAPFFGKGHSKLFDKNGMPVQAQALRQAADPKGKADAVRHYLKAHGGILEIQIHDIPSINKPKPADATHKERLLSFNCGVEGGGPRVKAYQYLVVNSAQPTHQWVRRCQLGWGMAGLKTSGLRPVPPPPQVANPRPPVFVSGECW